MKKLAIVAAAAAALTSAHAAPFNGFSLGGNIGAAFTKYKTGAVSKSKTNLMAALFAGYTKSFSANMFAGADLGLTYERFSALGAGDKAQNVFGVELAPRLGYKFNESTAVYGKIAVGTQFMTKEMKNNFKSTSFFVTPAVGVEKAFNNVSIRGEFGYKIQKLKTKAARGVDLKKNAFVATFGAAYNF
ncbi:MAG: hypothetical protein CNLJKLNK_00266 [Holosporales bacterium]